LPAQTSLYLNKNNPDLQLFLSTRPSCFAFAFIEHSLSILFAIHLLQNLTDDLLSLASFIATKPTFSIALLP